MNKKLNWRSELVTYVHSVSRKEFEWGKHDCAIFLGGAINAMTGKNLTKKHIGRYKTAAGALKYLRKLGVKTYAEFVGMLFEEIPVSMAQVGDIALIAVDDPIGHVGGIIQGERVYVVRPGELGVGTVLLTEAAKAFRV